MTGITDVVKEDGIFRCASLVWVRSATGAAVNEFTFAPVLCDNHHDATHNGNLSGMVPVTNGVVGFIENTGVNILPNDLANGRSITGWPDEIGDWIQ